MNPLIVGTIVSWVPSSVIPAKAGIQYHYVVKGGYLEVVKYLLSVGADVNAHEEDKIGETPLGEIAGNCSYEMAELLVKAGANPTIRGWMQVCALDRARDRKKEEGRRVYRLLSEVAKRNFHQ